MYDDDEWDDREHDYDSDDMEERDEWVFDCRDPGCCMNFAPHFRSECHTPEMIEAMEAEHADELPKCSCPFGNGAMFHLEGCALRT